MNPVAAPIMVGIDGSATSLDAGLWAAEEAVRRGTSVRLVAIADAHDSDVSTRSSLARRALRIVKDAIGLSCKRLCVDTSVVRGDPAQVFAEESRTASLVCLSAREASSGGEIGGYSLASRLAQVASSPIVIVRQRSSVYPATSDRWVVAVIDDVGDADVILSAALVATRQRNAALMVLMPPGCDPDACEFDVSRRLDATDVEVWLMPTPKDLPKMLAQAGDAEQLVVVGADNPRAVEELTGLAGCFALRGTCCSVLVLPVAAAHHAFSERSASPIVKEMAG